MNVSELAITLKSATGGATAMTLNYGRFIQTVLDFLILAWCVFLMVKGINLLRHKAEAIHAGT